MFAVVDDDQQFARPQIATDDILDGGALPRPQSPNLPDGRHDVGGVGNRCQLNQPRSVGQIFGKGLGGFHGQPRLPGAAHAGQGDQTVIRYQPVQFSKLISPTDE